VLALAALVGLAAGHQRLTRALDERRLPARTVAVALVMAAGGALLFVAWLHQL
jgi:hypothetical protein